MNKNQHSASQNTLENDVVADLLQHANARQSAPTDVKSRIKHQAKVKWPKQSCQTRAIIFLDETGKRICFYLPSCHIVTALAQ